MLRVTSSRCGSTPSEEANLGLFPSYKQSDVCLRRQERVASSPNLRLEICYIKIARTEPDSDHEGLRQHFFSEQGLSDYLNKK